MTWEDLGFEPFRLRLALVWDKERDVLRFESRIQLFYIQAKKIRFIYGL